MYDDIKMRRGVIEFRTTQDIPFNQSNWCMCGCRMKWDILPAGTLLRLKGGLLMIQLKPYENALVEMYDKLEEYAGVYTDQRQRDLPLPAPRQAHFYKCRD